MKETTGNIWNFIAKNWIVVPVNGTWRKNGEAVMGAGMAYQAARIFPYLPKRLGDLIRGHGNHSQTWDEYKIITFPTKYQWQDKSDIKLITRSSIELKDIADRSNLETPIYLPQVGCGLGKLKWEDVKAVIGNILDDRFTVVMNDDPRYS